MKDYLKGKIYKIVCNLTNLTYIGSTCEPTLARRLASHVGDYMKWLNGKHRFITSFKIIEGGNYNIILVEECPCESSDQLHARERHYIETVECVNKVIPTRSMKEWKEINKEKIKECEKIYREANKDHIKVRKKQYNEDNKEHIKEYKKEYRETNKEIIRQHRSEKLICLCGSTYSRSGKSEHEKTKKHQDYVNSEEV